MRRWERCDDGWHEVVVETPWRNTKGFGSESAGWPFLVVVAATVVVASGLTIACLDGLDHVYSWDQLKYHAKAIQLSHGFQSSFLSTASRVAQSTRNDNYNDLAAVPLAAWVMIFGEGRQAYVLGNLLLYAVPTSLLFALMMCAAHRRFCDRPAPPWLAAGWVCIPWLIGGFWTPTVLGRVGVGGLGLVFAAVALHIRRPLESQRWWVPVGVGGLLISAFFFRRWYGFAVVGILVAIAVETLFALMRKDRAGDRVRIVGNFGILLLTPAILAITVAMPIVSRVLFSNYLGVFESYQQAGGMSYLWGSPWSLVQRLGWPSILVVVAAFVVGWRHRPWRRFLAATTIAGVVSMAVFLRLQAPGVHHLLLWIGIQCTILGIGLAVASTWPRWTSRTVIGVSAILLSTSVAAVLFLERRHADGPELPWWNSMAPSMTVADFLPKNVDLVLATVGFLEANIPSGSSIAFLSSNLSLNDETLRRIRLSLPEQDIDRRYRFLQARRGGLRGAFPHAIFRADYVVIVEPVFLHDRPGQNVIRIPANWLARQTEPFATCFQRVAGPTSLPNGRAISAFEIRPGMKAKAVNLLAEHLRETYPEHRVLFDPDFGAPR